MGTLKKNVIDIKIIAKCKKYNDFAHWPVTMPWERFTENDPAYDNIRPRKSLLHSRQISHSFIIIIIYKYFPMLTIFSICTSRITCCP